MAKKTEAEIDAEVAAELAAEAEAAAAAQPPPVERKVVVPTQKTLKGRTVVKVGLFNSFQIVGAGDVFTFLDSSRYRLEMVEEPMGVRCLLGSRLNHPGGPLPKKEFFVPWSNITYLVYGI